MTVSSTTTKNSYSGNGSNDTFAYGFKIFDDDDITVIIRTDATGTETVKTKTTHYTVTNVGNASGGNVVFTGGNIPSSGETVVLRRTSAQTQTTDYVANDPFPAATHEAALDKLTFLAQEQQEELNRAIKISRTNTMTSTEFTVGATDRANKVLAFDSSGEIQVTQEIGTFRGNWAASTAYEVRDLVKDTSTNNIFIVNSAHTSSGAQPLTTNANSAKYDLIVDAASATTSATAAASSATAAASSASTASTQASNASTSASTASTQASNASTSASAAATSATAAATSATAAAASATAAASAALAPVSNDTSPELGGDLDVLTHAIVSSSDRNIALTPNGSGVVRIDGNVDIQTGEIVLKNGGSQSNVKFYCESSNAHYAQLTAPAHSDFSGNVTIVLPATAGTLALTSQLPTSGISSGNVATFGSGVADDDFLRVNGTTIEGRSASEVLSDIGATTATAAADEATALAIALG